MQLHRTLLFPALASLGISAPDLLLLVGQAPAALWGALGLVHCLFALAACWLTFDHENALRAGAGAMTETAKAIGCALACGGQLGLACFFIVSGIGGQCFLLQQSVQGSHRHAA